MIVFVLNYVFFFVDSKDNSQYKALSDIDINQRKTLRLTFWIDQNIHLIQSIFRTFRSIRSTSSLGADAGQVNEHTFIDISIALKSEKKNSVS